MSDKGEKITVGDALLHEYKAVKLEKEKGATIYGLSSEPIDKLIERLERQLKDLGYVDFSKTS